MRRITNVSGLDRRDPDRMDDPTLVDVVVGHRADLISV